MGKRDGQSGQRSGRGRQPMNGSPIMAEEGYPQGRGKVTAPNQNPGDPSGGRGTIPPDRGQIPGPRMPYPIPQGPGPIAPSPVGDPSGGRGTIPPIDTRGTPDNRGTPGPPMESSTPGMIDYWDPSTGYRGQIAGPNGPMEMPVPMGGAVRSLGDMSDPSGGRGFMPPGDRGIDPLTLEKMKMLTPGLPGPRDPRRY